jgi:hypothetical protein
MESPEEHPETLSAEQASEELDEERGPGEGDREGSEAVPTRTDIDEELEDRGDV